MLHPSQCQSTVAKDSTVMHAGSRFQRSDGHANPKDLVNPVGLVGWRTDLPFDLTLNPDPSPNPTSNPKT